LYGATVEPPTEPGGYTRQLDPTRQPRRTKDGYIAVAPYQDERWVRFFNAAGHGALLQDPRFIDQAARRENTSQMYVEAASITPERTTDEWLDLLKKAQVPAYRANDIGQVVNDPHLKAVGLFKEREHPTEGKYIEVMPPVRFSGFESPPLRFPPRIGEHTEEINRELGITTQA
jgi:crotonobetainyl-CoA:carnitine CoA-transferase CaiB-like acyl-CoA transferase